MKKVVCKVEYDTEKAELVAKYVSGEMGDPAGYEETLYQNEGGFYFLYTNGGATAKYTKESIKRISKERVKVWLANH